MPSSVGRASNAISHCAAMSSVPRRSAYRAFDRVTEDTVRVAAEAARLPTQVAELAVAAADAAVIAAARTARMQAQLHNAGMMGEHVQVQVVQVPRGEGTQATHDRRDCRELQEPQPPPPPRRRRGRRHLASHAIRGQRRGQQGGPLQAASPPARSAPRLAAPGGGDTGPRPGQHRSRPHGDSGRLCYQPIVRRVRGG